MKKSLLALAVLGAFAATAHAQSSVTVYGSIDAGIRYQSDVNTAGNSQTRMLSGVNTTSRLGFRGTEDLGGGLKARFNLENGFLTDTGDMDNAAARIFNRTASVGLGGTWGGIDLGRQYTVAFRTIGLYDPFNYKFTGIIPLAGGDVSAGTRFDNDIQYTGNFGPVTARAEYALGEQPGGGLARGSSMAVGGSYADGPFAVGAAYTKRNDFGGVAGNESNHWTLGGAYKFGPARVAAGYVRDSRDVAAAGTGLTRLQHAWVGGSYTLTPATELSLAYYHSKNNDNADSKRQLLIVGATYALSKRTSLYAEYDYAKVDGAYRTSTMSAATWAATNQDKHHGFAVGVNHLF